MSGNAQTKPSRELYLHPSMFGHTVTDPSKWNDMLIKAAQYVRMSSEQQPMSVDIQKKMIALYASQHGMELVKTYADEAKSGLTLSRREGMQQLLRDVLDVPCAFEVVLVLDVSRWGRFQDVDEAAYHEFHCRKNGVRVHYIAEQFNSSTPFDAILKQMKRAMASEYSRELGAKTRAGVVSAVEAGFASGRLPCLGYRRVSVSASGVQRGIIEPGQRKAAATDRVRWILGPEAELETVRAIFRRYSEGESVNDIVRRLHAQGVHKHDGGTIATAGISALLANELVIGRFTWGRRQRTKTKLPPLAGPMVNPNMVAPLIDINTWNAVQERLASDVRKRYPNGLGREELLGQLRLALAKDPLATPGKLSSLLLPCAQTYKKRFGTIYDALEASGYGLCSNSRNRQGRSTSHYLRQKFVEDIRHLTCTLGIGEQSQTNRKGLRVSGWEMTVSLARKPYSKNSQRWVTTVHAERSRRDRWLLILRLNEDHCTGKDFYLLPPDVHASFTGSIGKETGIGLEPYRLTNVQQLADRLSCIGSHCMPVDADARWFELS